MDLEQFTQIVTEGSTFGTVDRRTFNDIHPKIRMDSIDLIYKQIEQDPQAYFLVCAHPERAMFRIALFLEQQEGEQNETV